MYREKEIFYRINSWSFGDTLAATPTLRRLYYAYAEKINIVTNNKKVFENNPYVKRLLSFEEFDSLIIENSDYEILDSFIAAGKKDGRGIEKKHSIIDIRQLHSMDLGFQLLPEQMSYDYYPNKKSHKWNLPSEYVVLHVTSNWANRTWAYADWERVIQWLSDNKIFTVTVGMDYAENLHASISNKPLIKKCPTFKNLYGIDLTNKGDLDDMWHIINEANCIVTMDSGPLHIAGTTDTSIIQLGSAIDWRYRAPYRNGSQEYKYKYIGGSCQIFCNSNLFYNVETWGTINAVPPMVDCPDNKPTFECHPTSSKVIEELKNNINKKSKMNKPIEILDYEYGKITYSIGNVITENIELIVTDMTTGFIRDRLNLDNPIEGEYWWVPAPGNETSNKNNLGSIGITILSNNNPIDYYYFSLPEVDNLLKLGDVPVNYLANEIEDSVYPTYWEIFINDDYRLNDAEPIGGIILDIGANYGLFSMRALDQLKPNKIICYEPNLYCCGIIDLAIELNNINNIEVISQGVGGKTRTAYLTGISKPVTAHIENEPTYDYTEVEIISINDLLDNIQEEEISLAKFDCEGAEKEIFTNITQENLKRINRFLIEYHSQEIRNIILDLLISSDYDILERGQDIGDFGIIRAIKKVEQLEN